MTRRPGKKGGTVRRDLQIVGQTGNTEIAPETVAEQQPAAPTESWLPVETPRAIVKTEQQVLVDAVRTMGKPVFVQLEGQQEDETVRRRTVHIARPGNVAELFPADEEGMSNVVVAELGSLAGVRLALQDVDNNRLGVPITLAPLGPDEAFPEGLTQANLPHCTPIGPNE